MSAMKKYRVGNKVTRYWGSAVLYRANWKDLCLRAISAKI